MVSSFLSSDVFIFSSLKFRANSTDVDSKEVYFREICIIQSAFSFFNNEVGPYLEIRPLPLPKWNPIPGSISFDTIAEFENMYKLLRKVMRQQLREECYSTVHNFLKFYDDYRLNPKNQFEDFFLRYKPNMIYNNFSCTGLALDLLKRIASSKLTTLVPRLISLLYLVSSEEIISDVDDYCKHSPPDAMGVEKEHVLICLRIFIANRPGYILLDPGYHLRCPIIVMEDGRFPQSTEPDDDNWYTQSTTSKCSKEYKYVIHRSRQYVKWIIRETKNGTRKMINNLIHCGNAFMSPLDVVERRNLVFDFKNLIARNENGLHAGMYFVMKRNGLFVLFYPYLGRRKEVRIPFSYFSQNECLKEFDEAIRACNMKIGYCENALHDLMRRVVNVSEDERYMNESKELDDKINNSSIY